MYLLAPFSHVNAYVVHVCPQLRTKLDSEVTRSAIFHKPTLSKANTNPYVTKMYIPIICGSSVLELITLCPF